MRWIDFDNKRPTDAFPGWEPWSEEQWQEWLTTSKDLLSQVETMTAQAEALEQSGNTEAAKAKRKVRNDFMSSKSAHWGKLKPWLLALSHGKCWFSESKDIYSHYHVEHFRPKSEAKELDGSELDGYWWLAFDYSNYRICGSVGSTKKGGWFPLREGSMRSCYAHRCEESETPYLLDPTNVVDVMQLAFNEEGLAVAAPGASPWAGERVDVSIERLKLNAHEALTEARRSIWQKVLLEAREFEAATARCVTGANPGAQEQAKAHARAIRQMAKPESPLSAVVLWCLRYYSNGDLLKLAQ